MSAEVVVEAVNIRGTWDLSFDCRWCLPKVGVPVRHHHGGGSANGEPTLGERVSHCPSSRAPGRYTLVMQETPLVIPDEYAHYFENFEEAPPRIIRVRKRERDAVPTARG